MPARSVHVRGTAYPLVLPTLRDPRLHVAAVIISVHVLGQVALHFRVSVPQILAAILTCAVIEVVLTFRQSRAFVWPASAMLTGSGVALILRVVGTPPDDPWGTSALLPFAAVAGLSLLSKYVIRYRGSHVFNPSNVGLVVAFVVLGLTRVEPLDFWWAPLNPAMLLAYAVILAGGLLITRRLKLLALAATFWVALAAGLGVLTASGHCMTTNWAFAPVCGVDFWRVIVTSPEVMVFLFFMITDPKTVPTGRVGRVVFGIVVAAISTLLIAPQTDEFGTKVGLLAGLVIACAARPLLDRLVPAPGSAADDLRRFASRLAGGDRPHAALRWALARTVLGAVAVLVLGVGIVAAGTPARGVLVPNAAASLNAVVDRLDPATFPTISVDQAVTDWDPTLAGAGIRDVLVTLAQNLEIEDQALLRADPSLLTQVDHGDRLIEMQGRLPSAGGTGTIEIAHYRFDSVSVALLRPFGRQDGLSLGFRSLGTETSETYDAAGVLQARRTSPFSLTFAVRRATGARWLNVAVLPPG
jgi:Na+-translocating ferredoxin:NAD+ oxidoreductase RnfD subunit